MMIGSFIFLFRSRVSVYCGMAWSLIFSLTSVGKENAPNILWNLNDVQFHVRLGFIHGSFGLYLHQELQVCFVRFSLNSVGMAVLCCERTVSSYLTRHLTTQPSSVDMMPSPTNYCLNCYLFQMLPAAQLYKLPLPSLSFCFSSLLQFSCLFTVHIIYQPSHTSLSRPW